MGQNGSSLSAIVKTRLNAKQREAVEFYLTRTTLLWNFLVHHTKDHVEAYINSHTKESDDVMAARLIDLENALADLSEALSDDHLNTAAIVASMPVFSPKWREFMPRIVGIDLGIIYSRVDDFERACRLAKKDRIDGKLNQPTGLPQHKNANSSHSVRFASHQFEIDNGVIKVNGEWKDTPRDFAPYFEIEAPSFADVPIDDKTSLIITRRRQQAEISNLYGPSEEDNVFYTITLGQPQE